MYSYVMVKNKPEIESNLDIASKKCIEFMRNIWKYAFRERIQNKLPRLEQIQQISGSFFNSSIAPNNSRMRVYVTKIMENYSFVY